MSLGIPGFKFHGPETKLLSKCKLSLPSLVFDRKLLVKMCHILLTLPSSSQEPLEEHSMTGEHAKLYLHTFMTQAILKKSYCIGFISKNPVKTILWVPSRLPYPL